MSPLLRYIELDRLAKEAERKAREDREGAAFFVGLSAVLIALVVAVL